MKIRRKYTPIYKDATALLRPKTGLNDMVIQLDPGLAAARARRRRAGRSRSARRCPTSTSTRSSPRSTPTRARTCSCSSAAAARASAGRAGRCRPTLKRFEPTGARPRPAQRRAGRAPREHPPHDPQLPAARRGARRQGRRARPRSSTPPTASSRAFAAQDAQPARGAAAAARRRSTTTDTTLGKVDALGDDAGADARRACGPAARALGPDAARGAPVPRARRRRSSATSCGRSRATSQPTVRDPAPAARDLAAVDAAS